MSNVAADIDVTLLIEGLALAFKSWAVSYLVAVVAAVPGLSFLAWPIIGPIFAAIVGYLVGKLVETAVMQGFFMHTSIVKAAYAQDFINAVKAKANLPATASPEEFKNAELAQMDAFRRLVVVVQT